MFAKNGIKSRFSLNPIALTSDIEKEFLMITIDLSDHDVLHFLWVEDHLCISCIRAIVMGMHNFS